MTSRRHIRLTSIRRFSGTLINKIWSRIIFFIVYTAALVCAHNYVEGFRMDFPPSLIPVLGSVTGLLLVFRTNTAYDRYWEGRKLWSQITHNIRTLTRVVWAAVPEKGTEDLIEKLSLINLLVAFPYAVKNHLRGDYSYEAEDLRDLIAHLPRVVPCGSNGFHQTQKTAVCNEDGNLNGPYRGDAPMIGTNRNTTRRLHFQLRMPLCPSNLKNQKAQGSIIDKWLAHAPPTVTHIPLEIILYFTSFVTKMATKQEPMSVCFTTSMNTSLTALSEAMSGLERILQTPIPVAYAIHLEHTVWLYLLVLPFQLIGQLNWYTIPAAAFTAFAFLGILYIGLEIENPFGTDLNDLPIEQICERIKHEAYITVGTSIGAPSTWVMTDKNQPLWPLHDSSAPDLSNQSEDEVRDLLAQRAHAFTRFKAE